jgi:hypothetical protein
MHTFATEPEFAGAIDATPRGRATSADIRNSLIAGIGTDIDSKADRSENPWRDGPPPSVPTARA